MKRLSPLGVLIVLSIFSHAAETLVFKTPKDVAYEVGADGLTSIKIGPRELAHGNWTAWNAENWFKAGTQKVNTKTIKSRTIEVLSPEHARVRHETEHVVFIFDYEFASEDATITTRIENNHPDEPMNATGFSGLKFLFDAIPTGYMLNQHITYFQAHGVSLCHPGQWARIGGSFAADGSAGVGVSPWRVGVNRTLILWDYTDWTPKVREKLAERNLLYFVANPVPPRGAQTFAMKLRVSPDREWTHLLEPYKEHFTQTFGTVAYKADPRWICTDYLNHSQGAISPTNPYGFHGHRRIDTAEGAKSFCDTVIPLLKDGDGQAMIVWGQGGDDPRGCMYRTDFDVVPPEVETNMTTILARFKEAGLKFGLCTRPREMSVKQDYKIDQIVNINPDDAGHRAMLWRRFKNTIDKGCSIFYLDTFGDAFEDVKLMRFLRQQMGPDILTFCEHQCDAIMPYSGGYSETTLDAEDPANAHYQLWSGMQEWEIYRWLVPGAQMASRLYQIKGKAPADFEHPARFFFKHGITPLMPMIDAAKIQPVRDIQKEMLK